MFRIETDIKRYDCESRQKVERLIRNWVVRPTDLIYDEASDEWRPIGEHDPFASMFAEMADRQESSGASDDGESTEANGDAGRGERVRSDDGTGEGVRSGTVEDGCGPTTWQRKGAPTEGGEQPADVGPERRAEAADGAFGDEEPVDSGGGSVDGEGADESSETDGTLEMSTGEGRHDLPEAFFATEEMSQSPVTDSGAVADREDGVGASEGAGSGSPDGDHEEAARGRSNTDRERTDENQSATASARLSAGASGGASDGETVGGETSTGQSPPGESQAGADGEGGSGSEAASQGGTSEGAADYREVEEALQANAREHAPAHTDDSEWNEILDGLRETDELSEGEIDEIKETRDEIAIGRDEGEDEAVGDDVAGEIEEYVSEGYELSLPVDTAPDPREIQLGLRPTAASEEQKEGGFPYPEPKREGVVERQTYHLAPDRGDQKWVGWTILIAVSGLVMVVLLLVLAL